MRKSFFAALALLPACAFSQSLIVNMKDGQTMRIPVADIQNMTFKESPVVADVPMSVFTDPVLRAAVAEAAGLEANAETITGAQLQAITALSLVGSEVASLEGIENLTALTDLNIGQCAGLVNVDLSGMLENLESLQCGWCSNLETLKLGSKPALKELYAMYNGKLSSVDFDGLTALEIASIASDNIANVSVHIPTLVKFTCGGDAVQSVDLSGCDNLVDLSLNDVAPLEEFDIAPFPKLEKFYMTGTKVKKFTTEGNKQLTSLTLDNNGSIWYIDVHKSMKLNTLSCLQCWNLQEMGEVIMTEGQTINNMTGIYNYMIKRVPMEFPDDVAAELTDENFRQFMLKLADTDGDGKISEEEANAVTVVNAPNLGLTSVDFTYFKNIEELDLSGNDLESIDLSSLEKLTLLNLNDNKLKSLDVERLTSLKYLYANNNEISTISRFGTYGVMEIELAHNNLSTMSVLYMGKLSKIDVSYNQLTSVDIRSNDTQSYLNVSHNQLEEIRLWSLKAMVNLHVNDNPIKNLDEVNKLEKLETIDCSNTDITTLDLSQSPEIKECNATGCAELTTIYLPEGSEAVVEKDAATEVVFGAPAE